MLLSAHYTSWQSLPDRAVDSTEVDFGARTLPVTRNRKGTSPSTKHGRFFRWQSGPQLKRVTLTNSFPALPCAIFSPAMLLSKAGISLLALLLAASGSHQQDQSKAGQDVQPATLVHRVNPDYPDSWKKQGLQGTVHLHITIAKDGNVRDVKVVDGDSRLAKSAEKAVKQWRYKPALRNGEPVEVEATVAVAFALKAVQQ